MLQNARLQAAGIDVAALSAEQRQVLDHLSAEELDVLVAVKKRLDEADGEGDVDGDGDGDVEGHHFANRGGAYW
jgi:hypothetical protein